MRDSIVKIVNLSRIYRTVESKIHALKNIDLHIDTGQFIVILGPSGSGKTTLLNMIGGIDLPTEGSIFIDDELLQSKKQLEQIRRDKIGFIFQFFNLFPTLNAIENVEYVLELKGIKKSKTRELALQYLEQVGLEDRSENFPAQLSGGEQQRVAIARALAKEPEILLADEPTGELDFETGITILKLLVNLVNTDNKTVILVTHNREIAKLADRVIYLSSGEISKEKTQDNPAKPNELRW